MPGSIEGQYKEVLKGTQPEEHSRLAEKAALEERRVKEATEVRGGLEAAVAKAVVQAASLEILNAELADREKLLAEQNAVIAGLKAKRDEEASARRDAEMQVKRVKLVLEGANEEVVRLTNENQRLTVENEKQEQMAQTDELTGLLNRHGFKALAPTMFEMYRGLAREATPREGQKSRENRLDVSFNAVYIDLNGFKEINDNLSHAAGDEALKRVAEALLSSVRKSDTVFRMGGDEFLIVFISREDHESKRDTLARNKLLEENRFIVAERIRRKLAQTGGTATDKYGKRVEVPPLTAMIGVAQYIPMPGEGINEVVQAADAEALKLKDKKKLDKLAWEADPEHEGKPYPYTTEIAYAQPLE